MKLKITLLLVVLSIFCFSQDRISTTKAKSLINELQKGSTTSTLDVAIQLEAAKMDVFSFKEIKTLLPADLQKKYPNIRTFRGVSQSNSDEVCYVTITKNSIFGVVERKDGFVDFKNRTGQYDRLELTIENTDTSAKCGLAIENDEQGKISQQNIIPEKELNGGGNSENNILRGIKATPYVLGSTYKIVNLAMVLSYYQNTKLGITTKEQGLAWFATKVGILNERYGKEIAINFAMVSNTDNFIYLDASDPYPEASVSDAIDILPVVSNDLKTNLGIANYNLGILFHPIGVGRGLSGYCSNGVAVSDSSVGLAIHELGHALGVTDHSYIYESSSKIVAIDTGIEGGTSDSNKYFHGTSWETAASKLINNSSCMVSTATGNTPPSVTSLNPSTVVTIPISTPFVLSGTGTDPDAGASLVYGWDQIGLKQDATADANLLWAFKNSSATGNVRYFPDLANLLANTSDTHFAYPTTTRTISARFMIRDGQLPYGGATYQDVTFNTDATAGPFVVTYPNTNLSFTGAQSITVTWNVANTTNANVNTQFVNILLSTDGGYNWSTLSSNTANDGTESVTLPDVSSTTCRIKVEPVGNIYFDISDVNFSIASSAVSDFNLTAINNYNTVYNETSASFTFNFTKLGSFSNDVNVTYTGIPAGASIPSPVQLSSSSDFNVVMNGLNNVTLGKYTISITLTENGGTLTKSSTFTLIKKAVGDAVPGSSLNVTVENKAMIAKISRPLTSNTFTIMGWMKLSAASRAYRNNGLICIGTLSGYTDAYPSMTGISGIGFNSTNSSNTFVISLKGYSDIDTGLAVPLNVWNHVALVVTPTQVFLYLNGNLVFSKAQVTNVMNLGENLTIGKSDWFRTVFGEYDEVKIFNKSLSDIEVQEEVHRNVSTNNNLIQYYQFNEASGNPVSKVSFDDANLSGATRAVSVIPVGAADASTINKPLSLTSMGATNTSAVYFPQGNTITGNITAHKINVAPNSFNNIPADQTNMTPGAYWEINSYPTSTNETLDVQFKLASDILPTDIELNYILYYRNQTESGDWQYVGLAESVNPSDDTVLFKSVPNRAQFLVYRSTSAAINITGTDSSNSCFRSATFNKLFTYNVKGLSLANPITVTSSNADVLISTSPDSGYSTTLTLMPTNGSVDQTIYANYPSTVIGAFSSTIAVSSPNTVSKSIVLSSGYRKANDRGNALRLNGSNGAIKLSFPKVPNDFTIEFWYKPIGAFTATSHKIGTNANTMVYVDTTAGDIKASLNSFTVSAPAAYVLNKWTHVAVTYNRSTKTLSLYVNGKFISSTANVTPPASWATFYIGNTSASANGEIDEYRIWSSVRTEQQIQENMHLINDLSTACTDGLLTYHQFEEPLNTGLFDVTGYCNVIYSATNFPGNPTQVVSSAPIGFGKSQTLNVDAEGDYNFNNVGLTANFTGTLPNGKVVVSRIDALPFAAPSTTGALSNQYWVIKNYGTNSGLNANLTFRTTDFVTTANTSDYGFYKRESNEYGTWDAKVVSNAVNSSDITFNGITSFSQFILDKIVTTLSTDATHKDKVMIYPNPVKEGGLLSFYGLKNNNNAITIYDLSGKIVYKGSIVNQKMYIPYYITSGTYILNVSSNSSMITSMKLIVK